jgi:hypothetical protein
VLIGTEPFADDALDSVSGVIEHATFMGAYHQLRVLVAARHRLLVQTSHDARYREGDTVSLAWRPEHLIALKPSATQ